jgi:iron uptake system component EfeO
MTHGGSIRQWFSALSVGAVALSLAGCGSGSGSGGGSTGAVGDGTATVTITDAGGCQVSAATLPAGALTFKVTNQDATAVNAVELLSGERIVGEKENLPPGFSGSFSVNLDGGRYTLYCPGAQRERVPLTVTGTSAAVSTSGVAGLLKQGTATYAKYVTTQAGYLVAGAKTLQAAIDDGDLAGAQAAYMHARPYYEKIEPVAELFSIGTNDLDADLDARINDVSLGKWQGFHRIERGLFEFHSVAGLRGYAAGLVANVKKLERLTHGISYTPFELANGAQELLDEVASSKITGEEERYSHIDVLDVENNDEGAEQAFADLQPALARIDAALTKTIAARFAALDALVDTYRTDSNPSGFVFYGVLTAEDKRRLAAAIKAVQEPLSQVASKIAGA